MTRLFCCIKAGCEANRAPDSVWCREHRPFRPLPHTVDADCTIDADHACVVCGVYHGPDCRECGGSGFHLDGCSELLPPPREPNTPQGYDANGDER